MHEVLAYLGRCELINSIQPEVAKEMATLVNLDGSKLTAVQLHDQYIKPLLDKIGKQIDEDLAKIFIEQQVIDEFDLGCFDGYRK